MVGSNVIYCTSIYDNNNMNEIVKYLILLLYINQIRKNGLNRLLHITPSGKAMVLKLKKIFPNKWVSFVFLISMLFYCPSENAVFKNRVALSLSIFKFVSTFIKSILSSRIALRSSIFNKSLYSSPTETKKF